MSQSPQATGLSSQQWSLLLIAFLMGVASVFLLDKIVPVQGPSQHVVQAATENH